MKKVLLLGVMPFMSFAEPQLVYEPPKVAKFEVYGLLGKPKEGKYFATAGVDWRVGYPFLLGVFYGREDKVELGGIRAKVRIPLFWKVKNDLGVGALYERRGKEMVSFIAQAEQVIFFHRSFSLRVNESYIMGQKEVERWVISLGFGF